MSADEGSVHGDELSGTAEHGDHTRGRDWQNSSTRPSNKSKALLRMEEVDGVNNLVGDDMRAFLTSPKLASMTTTQRENHRFSPASNASPRDHGLEDLMHNNWEGRNLKDFIRAQLEREVMRQDRKPMTPNSARSPNSNG